MKSTPSIVSSGSSAALRMTATRLTSVLELIKELRYKLRMLGVPIDGPAVVWCDNQSVANGAAVPEAKLNKKHLGICYHAVREASAAKIWQVGFINQG